MAKPQPKPIDEPVVVSLDTSRTSKASIVVALEAHARSMQAAGDYAQHGAVSDVIVAAGALKVKTAAIQGLIPGELGVLIDRLYEIL